MTFLPLKIVLAAIIFIFTFFGLSFTKAQEARPPDSAAKDATAESSTFIKPVSEPVGEPAIAKPVAYDRSLGMYGPDKPKVKLDLPILESPYNFQNGLRFPAMQQSMMLSTDFYQLGHLWIERTFYESSETGGLIADFAFDILSFYLPLGSSWMHEEWHRAIMGHRGIDSYDEIYYFQLFKPLISVSHEQDADLINLKKDHPADLVRLSAAGFESQAEQNLEIEKRLFFIHPRHFDNFVLWYNTVNNIFYFNSCASSSSNAQTDDQNTADGAQVSSRDFTGLDCTGWVYDLFRPDEPYAARGTHPSGVGINRYRKWSDLSVQEQDYLLLESRLQFLNLIDPYLLGFDYFQAENPVTKEKALWNFAVKHLATSFGMSSEVHIFWKEPDLNFLASFKYFSNGRMGAPGFDLIVFDAGVTEGLKLSPEIAFWMQPEHQRFDDDRFKMGGLFGVKATKSIEKSWNVYVEPIFKTDGWVAGDPSLESSITVILGLETLIF